MGRLVAEVETTVSEACRPPAIGHVLLIVELWEQVDHNSPDKPVLARPT